MSLLPCRVVFSAVSSFGSVIFHRSEAAKPQPEGQIEPLPASLCEVLSDITALTHVLPVAGSCAAAAELSSWTRPCGLQSLPCLLCPAQKWFAEACSGAWSRELGFLFY